MSEVVRGRLTEDLGEAFWIAVCGNLARLKATARL